MGAAGQKRLIAAVQRPGLRRDRRWRQGFDRRQARVIAGGCRQRRRHFQLYPVGRHALLFIILQRDR